VPSWHVERVMNESRVGGREQANSWLLVGFAGERFTPLPNQSQKCLLLFLFFVVETEAHTLSPPQSVGGSALSAGMPRPITPPSSQLSYRSGVVSDMLSLSPAKSANTSMARGIMPPSSIETDPKIASDGPLRSRRPSGRMSSPGGPRSITPPRTLPLPVGPGGDDTRGRQSGSRFMPRGITPPVSQDTERGYVNCELPLRSLSPSKTPSSGLSRRGITPPESQNTDRSKGVSGDLLLQSCSPTGTASSIGMPRAITPPPSQYAILTGIASDSQFLSTAKSATGFLPRGIVPPAVQLTDRPKIPLDAQFLSTSKSGSTDFFPRGIVPPAVQLTDRPKIPTDALFLSQPRASGPHSARGQKLMDRQLRVQRLEEAQEAVTKALESEPALKARVDEELPAGKWNLLNWIERQQALEALRGGGAKAEEKAE
jgi:hypothetical protein